MGLKDDSIKEIVEQFKKRDEQFSYYLYGIISQSNLGRFCIFLFSDKKVDMIEVVWTDTVVSNTVIPIESIKTMKISNWLLGLGRKINIVSNDGEKVVLKISKYTLGLRNQKKHLENVEYEYKRLGLIE